ncbi:phosphatase PAP2 family protein [Microbulbifer variabilis]|uniref:phosphatase PAP2 family protein n=1 Tax=Microbulbifer variabilis TaxID=266805 RepID=UPI001CFD8E3E|nr:phosphatase PAP2 family protein [Microbulbifer variabilis]
MDNQFLLRQVFATATFLVMVIVIFDFTNIDLWLQSHLYQYNTESWLLNKHHKIQRQFFYDGPKQVLTYLVKIIPLMLVVFWRSKWIEPYRYGLIVVLVSIVLTVAIVGGLKTLTNIPCPKDLSLFGGDYPYITFLHRVSIAEDLQHVRCFPAGHASGGFAMLSLFFLFRQRRNQWIGFALGMSLGWIFGIYKMLIGDHFLSHTLVSMCIAWLVTLSVAAFVNNFFMRGVKENDIDLEIDNTSR